MPDQTYVFDDSSYVNLAGAGIDPMLVTDVLYARRQVRRHIGSYLTVAAVTRENRWLVVALIEGLDDEYTVTSARYLDDDEIKTITELRGFSYE